MTPSSFMPFDQGHMDALLVDPAWHGHAIGTSLVRHGRCPLGGPPMTTSTMTGSSCPSKKWIHAHRPLTPLTGKGGLDRSSICSTW